MQALRETAISLDGQHPFKQFYWPNTARTLLEIETMIGLAAAEVDRLQQVANETEDRRRHLEDVSCRQQNEIKRLNTRITNLWYALDRVKHGAEYCDELGDLIDRALRPPDGEAQ